MSEKNTNTQVKKELDKFDFSNMKNPPRYDLHKNRLLEDKTENSLADDLDKQQDNLDKSANLLSMISFIASRL